MALINEFVEKVLNENDSFSINIKEEGKKDTSNYYFLQSQVGKARYIYGMKSWNDDKFYSNIDLKPELVAIISNGVVYVVDEFFLETVEWLNHEVILPKHTIRFEDIVKAKNDFVNDVIFLDFYTSLETKDYDSEDIKDKCTLKDCERAARTYLLSKNPMELFQKERLRLDRGMFLNERDVANILCGFMDIKEEMNERLQEEKETWIVRKSMNKKIEELMENSETVLDWEIEIAKGLSSVEAKTVTVEFEFDGKRTSGKVYPDTLIRILREKTSFDNYDFTVTKQGERLLRDLGIENSWRSSKTLKCEHITKIMYGKKELYVRK